MIRSAAVLMLTPLIGGCVAAVIPAVAASAIVKTRMDDKQQAQQAAQVAPMPSPTPAKPATDASGWQVISGVTKLPAPSGGEAPTYPAAPTGAVPETMQFLYGSGEGAALSVQAYQAFSNYIAIRVAERNAGTLPRQVVVSDGASLDVPHFDPCTRNQPLAAVFDIDETAILNLGFERDTVQRGAGAPFDAGRWERWEQSGARDIVAVPGAVRAITAARAAGVTVIFNSNRMRANAAQTAAAIDHAGLGPVKHGTTLWLQGDDGGGSGKDDRRWAIASGYCVIALVGDQLGDFSDLFNAPGVTPSARRALAASQVLSGMWGNGWFMLPNPVYGTALKGGFDEVFPQDKRWSDPAEGVK